MSHELRKQVGQRIRQLRGAAKLTQEALASRADISAKHLGEIERGQENVSLDYLARIAAALKVEPFELLVSLRKASDPERLRREALSRLVQRLDPDAGTFISDVLAVYLARRREKGT